MSTTNLNNDGSSIITGNDNIAIVDVFATVRGGRSLDVTDFAPKVINGGHVIIKETATGNYKPMPATDATAGNINSLSGLVAGTGYVNGVYENVPLQGGTGTGALATVTVAGGVVTVVTKTANGKDYTVADVLRIEAPYAGATGSGATINVATLTTTAAAYGALPAAHTYQGILIATIETRKPFAGILTQGTINPVACPYNFSVIADAFKAAVPLIDQRAD